LVLITFRHGSPYAVPSRISGREKQLGTVFASGDATGNLRDERLTAAAITPLLDHAWPTVRATLMRELAARGIDRSSCEDIGQEVASRALRHPGGFPSPDDLLRWSRRVGHNLGTDWYRRRKRLMEGPLPDMSGPIDVAREAEGRLLWATVETHIRAMTPQDQAAILDPLLAAQPARTRREAVARNMRRLRARERLRHLLDGVAAFVAVRLRGPVVEYVAGPSGAGAALLVVPGVVGLLLTPSAEFAAPVPTKAPVIAVPYPPTPAAAPAIAAPLRSPPRVEYAPGREQGGISRPSPSAPKPPIEARMGDPIERRPDGGGLRYEVAPTGASVDVDGDGEAEANTGVGWSAWCPPPDQRGVLSGPTCPVLDRLATEVRGEVTAL
jgi:DNA-directed RNA polymerase specialized sigma24 family protein